VFSRTKFGEVAGADVFLSLEYDPWGRPEDDDGMTAKQVEAWNKDEWHYVQATVSIELDGITIGSATYGGLEYGDFVSTNEQDEFLSQSWIGENEIWGYVGEELKGEAMSRAEENLGKLAAWKEAVACLESY
jgi:hypothetical protein